MQTGESEMVAFKDLEDGDRFDQIVITRAAYEKIKPLMREIGESEGELETLDPFNGIPFEIVETAIDAKRRAGEIGVQRGGKVCVVLDSDE